MILSLGLLIAVSFTGYESKKILERFIRKCVNFAKGRITYRFEARPGKVMDSKVTTSPDKPQDNVSKNIKIK